MHAIPAQIQESGTVIFVSHDAAAVVNLCDHAIMLDHGRLSMQGEAKAVSEAYHAAAAYAQPIQRKATAKPAPAEVATDPRASLIASSTLRNDIEVFRFDAGRSGFGDGSAKVVSASLADEQGRPLTWIVGGEVARLRITGRACAVLNQPILGFFLKDRLGQHLIGDNTYLSYCESPVQIAAGQNIEAVFEFTMPILPRGQYSFDIAIANGTQHEHVQADWVHDAIVLESHSSSVSTGLVGIPMRAIDLWAGEAG